MKQADLAMYKSRMPGYAVRPANSTMEIAVKKRVAGR
jgi:hypothetical protein